jgi:hypothetical protein
LMTGLNGSSAWTHLIPGFIVSGIGAGFVNPPLASTAIGVVEPERAGMASGINSTFRQIGLATSIAALGSIFTTSFRNQLTHALAPTPLAGRASQIADAVREGQTAGAAAGNSPSLQGELRTAISSSFAGALNDLLLVTGILALVGAVLATALIRNKDFAQR